MTASTTDLAALFRRTWELELLISGAVLFALFQLPTRLFGAFERLRVHVDEASLTILMLGFIYLQFIIFVLISTLIIHLAGRAYWVGLVGLRSVFPQGIRWRRLTTYGPRSKAFYRAAQPSLKSLIQTTDAFCSSLFSIAFVLSFVFFVSILVLSPAVGLALAIDRALFDGDQFVWVFYVLMLIFLLPAMLLPLLDKKIPRTTRDDRFGRVLRVMLRPYYWLFGAPLVNPIQMTFLSNSRKLVFWVVYLLIFVALFASVIGLTLMTNDAIRFNDLRYFPDRGDARVLLSAHYDDQRPPGAISTAPSIPSEIVEGPYLRLFLPYVPRFHNEQLAARCPELEPMHRGGLRLRDGSRYRPPDDDSRAAAGAALECLAGLYRITLDGDPPGAVDRSLYRHPGTGVRGVLIHLPAADLAPGKHLLRIETRTGLEDDSGDAGSDSDPDDDLRMHLIPFWR